MNITLKRTTAAVGAFALAATVLIAGAGAAAADPAITVLTPHGLLLNGLATTSGSGTAQPVWSSTVGCGTGNTAAKLFAQVRTGTGQSSDIAGTVPANTDNAFAGAAFDAPVSNLVDFLDAGVGSTFQLVVQCGANGLDFPVNLTDGTLTITSLSGAWTYTSGATVNLNNAAITVAPITNPNLPGDAVTLSATVTDPASPTGTVHFFDGGTDLGLATNSGGTYTLALAAGSTTTWASGSHPITAVYTPGSTETTYQATTSPAVSLVIQGSTDENIETTLIVQQGVFTYNIKAPNSTVVLDGQTHNPTDKTITTSHTMNDVEIHDGRHQTQDGWVISGKVSPFTGQTGAATGKTILASALGWNPSVVTANTADAANVHAGSAVASGTFLGDPFHAPSGTGLSVVSELGHAPVGHGLDDSELAALLTLTVPDTTAAGKYTATLSITAVQTGPAS